MGVNQYKPELCLLYLLATNVRPRSGRVKFLLVALKL